MKHIRKILSAAGGVLFSCGIAALFLFPLPVRSGAAEERYPCVWEDGSLTEEDYASAYLAFSEVTEEGKFALRRGEDKGTLEPSAAFSSFFRTAQSGTLADLLALGTEGFRRIDRLAAFRYCADKVWLSGGTCFAYSGEAFVPETEGDAGEVHLVDGAVSAHTLAAYGTTVLCLYPQSEFDRKTVENTSVERVVAQSPYASSGSAVYLDTPGGRRLLCGLPAAEEFTMEECDYADEGALLPCTRVHTLTLAFVGSSPKGYGAAFRGELAHLFSTGREYRVPSSLRKVRVTGGVLVSHAFYRCYMLEEIDACGVRAENIEADAFLDCFNLRLLHSPRADVRLQGSYKESKLPCGCTLFERTGD